MTNTKPGNDLISLQVAPIEQTSYHSREKVSSPVTMNNLGARLIVEGRHNDALRYLATSMKHVRVLLSRDRPQRRGGSNTVDMVCKQVNLAAIEGRAGNADTNPTTTPLSTGESSWEQRRGGQRPSTRRLSFRHRRSGTMAASSMSSGQQQEGRVTSSGSTLQTLKGEEDHPATDIEEGTVTTKKTAPCSPVSVAATTKTSLTSSNTFVYADPIVLDDEAFVCHRHRRCLMKITVTILFNMAVAHHLMARSMLTLTEDADSSLEEEVRNEMQRQCRSDLKRAVTLYTLSCRIHVFERLSMNEVIAMAHLNNLGQIHAILGNVSLSNAFFEKLLSNLALYTESYRDGKHHASRQGRRRLAGFYRNAAQVILRGPELAPAA